MNDLEKLLAAAQHAESVARSAAVDYDYADGQTNTERLQVVAKKQRAFEARSACTLAHLGAMAPVEQAALYGVLKDLLRDAQDRRSARSWQAGAVMLRKLGGEVAS
jgi:hypothetical protein